MWCELWSHVRWIFQEFVEYGFFSPKTSSSRMDEFEYCDAYPYLSEEDEFDDFYKIYCNLDKEQPYPNKSQDKKSTES
jgi:hypothetical protein